MLHLVRLYVPDFLVIMGPLIFEMKDQKNKSFIIETIKQHLKNVDTKIIYVPENGGKDPNLSLDDHFIQVSNQSIISLNGIKVALNNSGLINNELSKQIPRNSSNIEYAI